MFGLFSKKRHNVFVYGSGISEVSFKKSGIKFESFEIVSLTTRFKRVFTMPSIFGTGTFCTLIPTKDNHTTLGALVRMNDRSYKKYLKREKNYSVARNTFGTVMVNGKPASVFFTTVVNRNQPTTDVEPNPNYIKTIKKALSDKDFIIFLSSSFMGDKVSTLYKWYTYDDGYKAVKKSKGNY